MDDGYKGSDGAGCQCGARRLLAVFGITSHFSPDLQHMAWPSGFSGSKRMNTLLEKKEFPFCGDTGRRNHILSLEEMCFGQTWRLTSVNQ